MLFEAVVFDLFGTLVPGFPLPRFHNTLTAMADAVGADPDEFIERWYATWEDRGTGRLKSIAANVLRICNSVNVPPTDSQLAKATAIRVAFTREILGPRPDAISTLAKIKSSGRRLALISDCSAEVPELWPETPFASLIDVPVFSCVVGAKKPDPRIYRLACEGLGISPQKCLYVGDGFSQELAGARGVGMHPVLIAPPGEAWADSSQREARTWSGPRVQTLSEVVGIALESDEEARS